MFLICYLFEMKNYPVLVKESTDMYMDMDLYCIYRRYFVLLADPVMYTNMVSAQLLQTPM
jgi:hypothetical protein